MSDPNAWQNTDIAALLQQFMNGQPLAPTYSAKNGWMPQDAAWQTKNLNYQQDRMKSLMDPQLAMLAGPGAYDSVAMQEALRDPKAAVSSGTDYLMNVISHAPNSPEAVIAKKMLPESVGGKGMSAQQAVQEATAEAKQLGAPWPTEVKDGVDTGMPSKDLLKFAQKSWDGLMGDTPGQGAPTPWTKAGLSDPSMRFTPDLYNDRLGVARERADAQRTAMKAMQKKFDDEQKAVDSSHRMADAYPQQRRFAEEHSSAGGFNPLQFGAPGALSINTGMGTIDLAPSGESSGNVFDQWIRSHPAPQVQTNKLGDQLQRANMDAMKASNNAWLSTARATHRANEDTQAYGSPLLMQLMARQRALGG